MLPGFIPLLIYILADEIWGTKIGLLVAISTGIAELIFYLVKDKKFDKFILFDTSLLIFLGAISLALNNDTFFKLKPALISLIGTALLGVSAFTKKNIMLKLSKHYFRNIEFDQYQQKKFQEKLKIIFYIFAAYTILTFYSVWFMSNAAWAFISGGLFYIIFGIYFIIEMIKYKFYKKS